MSLSNDDSGSSQRLNIVIIGNSIVGCTTAYYLTRCRAYSAAPHPITSEATGLASGASSKAGGLLAQWAYLSNLEPLSLDLQRELATKHDGAQAWGHCTIRCGKLTAQDRHLSDKDRAAQAPLSWAQQFVASVPLSQQCEVLRDASNMVDVGLPDDLD